MTKTRIIQIASLVVIVTCVSLLYLVRQKKTIVVTPEVTKPIVNVAPPKIDVEKLEIDGKKVIGLPPGQEKVAIKQIHISNHPSEEWKPNLEKTLQAQGGNHIKDINIEKLDSFIWTESGIALHVDSVKITLKNDKDSTVSFNAMIDSQNGKILKNWNQPVIDNFQQQKNFKVRIDPRYHNE